MLRWIQKPGNPSRFKSENTLEKRREESERIRAKYPTRIPVICEKAEKSDIPDIDKVKFLVPEDLSVGQFVYVVRKKIRLPAETALWLLVNNTLPPTAALMSHLYDCHKDSEDGFLYINYADDHVFGHC
eukprot:TRINITY_DN10150_c0_g1_i1.p1 TRINITY_DN10150_c0_g1~~TRINITY_DN10150_c0_g1_i1.p1  ORF type:complete len:129 (+),score=25.06 TRINITY_DN10150_c0_g1_i1:50-436(+)